MKATPADATRVALSHHAIQDASFRTNQLGAIVGVAYDSEAGVEYDVREDGRRWNVNDDHGRDFRALTLRMAIDRAHRAQTTDEKEQL